MVSSSRLKSVTTAFDVLSRKAFFEDSVREAVWGNSLSSLNLSPNAGQPFEYFLPLVLNPQHAKKSIPLIKSSLVSILKEVVTIDKSDIWNVHTNITRKSVMQTIAEFQKFQELGVNCYINYFI